MRKFFKVVAWIVGGFIGLCILAGIINGPPSENKDNSNIKQQETEKTAPPPVDPRSFFPKDENNFIQIVDDSWVSYKDAENDFNKGAVRAERGRKICAALHGNVVRNWIGTIEMLSSSSEGDGAVAVRISPRITISTALGRLSDDIGGITGNQTTLISPGSKVASELSKMREGQTVTFSATFSPSAENDCFAENSMTQKGSMKNPNYTAKFVDFRAE